MIKDKNLSNINLNVNSPGEFDSGFNIELYQKARDHFSGLNTNFIDLNNFIISNLNTYQPVNLIGTVTSIPEEARFISVADNQIEFGEISK